MKLPLPFSFKKKELPKYYLVLLLREEKATAIIVEEIEGKAKVLGEHEEEFKESIDSVSLEDFLQTLDQTISTAESNLPTGDQTQQTIFGLKETWIDDSTPIQSGSKIKKEYLLKLKKACEALGLAPIGFLVIHEAIAHLLQEEEGAPVSAVLVEIGREYEAVSLLRAGRLVETHRAKIEDSKVKTADRLLHHFSNPQILPTRIILLNGQGHDEIQQEFISHAWSKSLPFLHVPQITILPAGFDAKAMLFGAASQMGFEVLGDDHTAHKKSREDKEEEAANEEKEQDKKSEGASEADFGFVIGKDIADTKKQEEQKEKPKGKVQTEEIQDREPQAVKNLEKLAVLIAIIALVGRLIKKLFEAVGQIKKPSVPSTLPGRQFFSVFQKGPRIVLLIPLCIVILIVLFLLYLLGEKADVTLFAKAAELSKKQDITLSVSDKTDSSLSILAVSFETIAEDGSNTQPATGTKQVGDKAKGTVTVYNNTSQTQVLSKGTIIVSDKGLKFDLDKDITVASASGDAFSGTRPGTVATSVTGDDIGPEYNLPSGTKFSVSGESSSVAAKNDNAFSGGSKKSVTVVSKDDISKASAELIKSLEQKAKDDVAKKITRDVSEIPAFLGKDIQNKEISKNAGDVSSDVTLKGTVTYKIALFKTAQAQDLAIHILSLNNSNLSAESVSYSFENVSAKDGAATTTFNAKAYLLPKINENELAGKVAGKSFGETKEILTKVPQISDISVHLHPAIPLLPKLLPRISSHIHFKVVRQ